VADILGQGPGCAQQGGGGVVGPVEGVEIVGERVAGHRFDQHQGAGSQGLTGVVGGAGLAGRGYLLGGARTGSLRVELAPADLADDRTEAGGGSRDPDASATIAGAGHGVGG
jgi:hypothetical protein